MKSTTTRLSLLILLSLLTAACGPALTPTSTPAIRLPTAVPTTAPPAATPLPTRPVYNPGELLDYTAQTGDTLPVLAVHFNTSVEEILTANPIIPPDVTTLPPGLPMQIPIYYRSFWGSPYQIIPDSLFVNGPAMVAFDTAEFLNKHGGWLSSYSDYVAGQTRSGAEIIDYVASNFSVSPQILLALLEYQAGAVTHRIVPSQQATYLLGHESNRHRGLYLQLVWAANLLNNGYYQWRSGELIDFDLADGTTERPDPWQNAATVSLQLFFNSLLPPDGYHQASGPDGLAATFQQLFGDPWEIPQPHIPGNLTQPPFTLPFEAGKTWAYTGGPHTGWGTGAPLAALDFAPPSSTSGCTPSNQWLTAVADGLVIRSETGILMLDLDMDGDDRTGWVILYLHIGTKDRSAVGTVLLQGDQLGHPSCEGGTSTGTHIHIARKYNGEWIVADSALPFVLEGWSAKAGDAVYQGTLVRYERTVRACECANQASHIRSTGYPDGVLRPE